VEPLEDDPWPDSTSEKIVPSTAPTLPLGTRVFDVSFWCWVRCFQQREISPVKLLLLNKEDAEASFDRRRRRFSTAL